MIGDQLSKQEDRILHRALESVVRTQFPNPRRNDCPGIETLRAIARKRISMRDPAIDHVGHCSPCFVELTNLRHALRRKAIVWKTGTAAAAVLVLAFLVNYVGFQRGDPRIRGQIQPRYQVATIDLRSASTARSVTTPGGEPRQPAIQIPRAIISLTMQLPIGSDVGIYEVQIRKTGQVVGTGGKGQANIENGITTLTVTLDTTDIPVGDYEIAWRLDSFDWRSYPIRVPQ